MSDQKQTEPAKAPTALERLEALEKAQNQTNALAYKVESISRGISSLSMAVQDALRSLEAVSRALIKKGLVSESDIGDELTNAEIERKEETEKSLIDQKLVEEAELSTAESLLVYKLSEKDGKVLVPRGHVDLSTIHESARVNFVGKTVNQIIDDNGRDVTVLRILNPVKAGQISAESSESSPVSNG